MLSSKSRPLPILNHLLAALPSEEYERLIPNLDYVRLPFMEVLYLSGEEIKHTYFPNEGIISF